MKVIKGFRCLGPTHKMFFVSEFISTIFVVYLSFDYVPEIVYSIMVSTGTLVLGYIFLTKFACYPQRWKIGEIVLLVFAFITVFHLPAHFMATSRITIKKELKDNSLLKADKFLLGWLVEDGQLSLYLDKNNFIGPHTILGRFINNSLQIFYFFYYLIPYISMHFMNLANCGKEIIFRFQHKGQMSPSHRRRWNDTLFLFGTYLLTCFLIFFTNTLVPASSPRKYIKDKFIHPLELTGLANYLNKKCKDDTSANSFPSGHVGEVLTIGLAYLGMEKYEIGYIIIVCTILIALATIFLRYHYFCDILMAVILAYLGYIINYYFGYKKYLDALKKEKEKRTLEISAQSEGIENKNHISLAEEVANQV